MKKALLLSFILFIVAPLANAEKPEIWMKKKWDYAINGYDTVSYFNESAPVEGNDSFVTEHKGVNWRFSSAENLALFEENPDKYTPQYGGHCAYGLGKNGVLVHGDPEVYSIVDDKLYLNLKTSLQKKWVKKQDFYITNADSVWPRALTEDIEVNW